MEETTLADGTVLPPCGRCREFVRRVDTGNMGRTEVLPGRDKAVRLRELLPHPRDEVF